VPKNVVDIAAPRPAETGTSNNTPEAKGADMAGHSPAQPVVSEYAIYDHPYVKRLEDRIEKLESKYTAQVKTTQEVMMHANAQLVELQRVSAVAQSKTLAEYLLKAKDYILGGTVSSGEGDSGNPQPFDRTIA
jgi:uncharacterized coiled-coil protein SlyX